MKAILICALLLAGSLFAVDQKGVMPLLVHVVDREGNPIEGASIKGPSVDLSKLVIRLKKGEIDAISRPVISDKMEYAIIYYMGGSTFERDGYSCSLPEFVEVQMVGFQTLRMSFAHRGALTVRPAENVVLDVVVCLQKVEK